MSYRKYLKDYRIDAQLDEKGRLKPETVYIGGQYTLRPHISANDKRLILAASILSWPALVGALTPITKASQVTYIIIPFAFSALPLFLVTQAAIALIREDESMTRKKAETISRRLPSNSLFMAILTGAAFLGLIFNAFIKWNEMLPGDIVFGVLSFFNAAVSLLIFIKTRKIKASAIDC